MAQCMLFLIVFYEYLGVMLFAQLGFGTFDVGWLHSMLSEPRNSAVKILYRILQNMLRIVILLFGYY